MHPNFFVCSIFLLVLPSPTLWLLSMVPQQSFLFFFNLFFTAGNSVLYPLGLTCLVNGAVRFTCTDGGTWLPFEVGHSLVTLGEPKSLFFCIGWKLYIFLGLSWFVYTSAQPLCCRNKRDTESRKLHKLEKIWNSTGNTG